MEEKDNKEAPQIPEQEPRKPIEQPPESISITTPAGFSIAAQSMYTNPEQLANLCINIIENLQGTTKKRASYT